MTLNNFIDRDSEKSILSFFLSDCKDLKFKNMLLAECREEFFTEKRELAFNAISELIREDVNPARIADHIKPHRGDIELFYDETNLQPLCQSCHSAKTMAENNFYKSKRQSSKGYGV